MRAEGRSKTESLLWAVGLRRGESESRSPGQSDPLRPFTIPNLVSLIRLALIPLFLVLALSSKSEVSTTAFLVFGIAAITDWLDGFLARLLNQHSRLGVLLDPLIDRLLVVAAMVVTWHFELLPRWAIALILARELFMLAVSRYALSRGLRIEVNWIGRISLWLIFVGAGLAMINGPILSTTIFLAGVALSLIATAKYLVDGKKQLDAR